MRTQPCSGSCGKTLHLSTFEKVHTVLQGQMEITQHGNTAKNNIPPPPLLQGFPLKDVHIFTFNITQT